MSDSSANARFGEVAVELGFCDVEQLQAALKALALRPEGTSLGDLLVDHGTITPRQLRKIQKFVERPPRVDTFDPNDTATDEHQLPTC